MFCLLKNISKMEPSSPLDDACYHYSWLPLPHAHLSLSLSLYNTTFLFIYIHIRTPYSVVHHSTKPFLKPHSTFSYSMAVSGFEGFEKRLELRFSGDDPVAGLGLRRLDYDTLEEILSVVQCTVIAALADKHFDSYVLSESSLFVYPTKIIIKTCGTIQLLKSIRPLVNRAADLGLTLSGCRYTRGSYIFPNAQPYPYTSFKEEVACLEESLPRHLCHRKAAIMPSRVSSHLWHVFAASDEAGMVENVVDETYTVEVCMTELDPALAKRFFLGQGNAGNVSGKVMTKATGIGYINPNALICEFGFDPCGYSMNGVDGDRYSTIHVTPEEGYSYASFECVGSVYDNHDGLVEMLEKVARIFRPGKMSVSTTGACPEVWTRVRNAMDPAGLVRRSFAVDEFPSVGSVAFQTFTTRRSKVV